MPMVSVHKTVMRNFSDAKQCGPDCTMPAILRIFAAVPAFKKALILNYNIENIP